MTAAKVKDVIARLPGCTGQAADAVSAYTQVKMEDAPMLLKISKSEFPDFWIRLPRHRWPKSRSNIEDPVVLLERNVYGHQDCYGKDNSRRFCWNLDGEKFRIGNVFFVHRKQELFLSGLRWWHQNDWKEAEYGSNVEEFDERRWPWRSNIISWPRIFGMHSTWMQTKCNQ